MLPISILLMSRPETKSTWPESQQVPLTLGLPSGILLGAKISTRSPQKPCSSGQACHRQRRQRCRQSKGLQAPAPVHQWKSIHLHQLMQYIWFDWRYFIQVKPIKYPKFKNSKCTTSKCFMKDLHLSTIWRKGKITQVFTFWTRSSCCRWL